MDIFKERYYNVNRKLLTLVGLWPFANRRSMYFMRSFFMIGLFLMTLPHGISAVVNKKDVDRFMLNTMSCLICLVMFLKMVALSSSEAKMEKVFRSMADNWLSIRDEQEQDILREYSENCRIFTNLYIAAIFTAGSLMSLLPMVPKVADIIHPLESARQNIYLLMGEYFIEREEHFLTIFFSDYATTMFVTVITIAVDSMYITAAEHCCALHAILIHRFHNFGKQPLNDLSNAVDDSNDKLYDIIQLHQRIISFTKAVGDSYSLCFLFIMTVNLAIIPLNACAILATVPNVIGVLPYVILFNAIILHAFTIFYPGQRILDSSLSLRDATYCNQWYLTPIRTRKTLAIIMLRCHQPVSLNAGGIVLINLETFSKVSRTAVSYITVMASFR